MGGGFGGVGWFQGGGPEENSGVTGAHLVLMAIAGQ